MIVVDVFDEDDKPLAGAVVKVFVDGNFLTEIKTVGGRAAIQISPTTARITIQASFRELSAHADIGPDVELWTFKLKVSQAKHLVILVHGINTRANWMTQVGQTLTRAGFECEPAGYGYFGVIRFLLPIDWLRRLAIQVVVSKIDAAIDMHKPDRVSIISHSFGSYVVSRIIEKEFRLKWHRVIFCGSVIPNTFPFPQLTSRFTSPILNEIGTRDFWPALATSVTWGYGSIGSHGYQGAPLAERWYRGFHHSDFLTKEHCEKAWVPFLKRGEVVDADAPDELPLIMRILTIIKIKMILVAILMIFIILPLIVDRKWTDQSEWMEGGSNPDIQCAKLAEKWEAENTWYKLDYMPTPEEQDWVGLRHAVYRYHCSGTGRLKWLSWRYWF
ncbi:hypothetical protein [Kaistia terrae]|uniref:Uncharacterized protein n=1 Tax=Kaistia terrae TaxID=537017 RepID=A0ABW0Q2Y8_9HYPH|nr:hypothetical protein [Kaistia terrae]MCX5581209.1 hypothetical protein [Kaistia terrae]